MFVKLYRTIGLGGTFDHLHQGHEFFLKFADQLADFLLIGVTDEKMVRDKTYGYSIQPFEVRKNAVLKFCHQHDIKCKVTRLTDPYGPTLNDESIQAIAVTEDTVLGGRNINQLRQKMNLRPLEIHVCNLVKDEQGEVISSSRIRAGVINRSGMIYDQIFNQDLVLTAKQKQFFAQVQGELVAGPDLNSMFNAVVGDRSLKLFLDHHWPIKIGVYDLKEKRTENKGILKIINQPNFQAKSPQGIISSELVKAIKIALNKNKKYILIDGEDDLAAVALMLLLPLEANIYYGQPDQGMVEMTVTEHKKNQFYELLKP
jgi:cytidyltransferase-like protein